MTTTKTQSGKALVAQRLAKLPQTKIVDTILVTPDIAEMLLAHNTRNRKLNVQKYMGHAATMTRGRWMDNGDTIRMSRTGKLLNGQHTLHAIVESGQTQDYIMVWGLEDEALDTVDTGGKRSLAQSLYLKGESNPNALGGAVRMIWQIANGATPSGWLTEPTYAEFYEYINQYPEIRDSVQVGSKVAKTLKVPASPIAAAHYFCAEVDANEADAFFTDMGDMGAVLADDSPCLALRNTAIAWATRGSVSRIEQSSLYDVCIRAFEAHQQGKKATSPYRLNRRPRTYRVPAMKP